MLLPNNPLSGLTYFTCCIRSLVSGRVRSLGPLGARRLLSSGPHGIDGRLPSEPAGEYNNPNTRGPDGSSEDARKIPSEYALAITDPFQLYQNYVSRGILKKDEAQLRAMKEFQKLYFRLKDYKPPEELNIKISLLIRQIEIKKAQQIARERGLSNEGNNTLFKLSHFANGLFRADPDAERKEVVKIITDEDELYTIGTPQGLLLNGEVGCGKSMLMDIFATTLPHESKMRWHYNNFILWVFNEMHNIQQERLFTSAMSIPSEDEQGLPPTAQKAFSMENEFILFEVAQKLIGRSTILLLDEFMLPDIAAANIVKILFTYYFKLGGVLVATSNKLPEELYSNEFHKRNFKTFVGILHNRCQTVDMNSNSDYRLINSAASVSTDSHLVVKQSEEGHDEKWKKLIENEIGCPKEDGVASTLKVYNRKTSIPLTYKNNTICYLEFSHICGGLFSASDYISLASNYRTVIIDNVPVLPLKMKNEARRFITLLDAIYEARCQCYIRSEVGLSELFFPDADENEVNRLKVQEEEMFAKTVMDMESPYRPNVSYYTGDNTDFIEKKRKLGNDSTDFQKTNAFTGEDEKFAYKRAVSRIQEMVGSDLWRLNEWVPIDETMRPWESVTTTNYLPKVSLKAVQDKQTPKIGEEHIWSMGKWTKLNGRRLKDQIAKKWMNSGMKWH